MHKIYQDAETQCHIRGWALADLDLLIICGDFQAYRNALDLNCASVPRRYRRLVDFPDYYSGKSVAPVLTLVIGGNHEASNYFFELYHGGWLAPNIYYLGAAGVVRYGPWRIAGLSGIYASGDYRQPHHERLPYDRDGIKSVYHVREYDVEKLRRVTGPVDIALSHDWPMWVELFGDRERLYKEKPHFLQSAMGSRLGSVPGKTLLDHLRPRYWFAGHMHAHFHATVQHKGHQQIDDTIRELAVSDTLRSKLPIFKKVTGQGRMGSVSSSTSTEFLALSKPGDNTLTYLALLEIDRPASQDHDQYLGHEDGANGKFSLCYDEEWLAIIRSYNDRLLVAHPETLVIPPAKEVGKVSSADIATHREWIQHNVSEKGLLRIPENFQRHAPVHDEQDGRLVRDEQPPEYPNNQTAQLADLLQMTNRLAIDRTDFANDEGGEVEFTIEWED